MQQNRHLALSIGDAGMGELRRQLAYKSQWVRIETRDRRSVLPLFEDLRGCPARCGISPGGGPGVTVLARRISAPRPARTISIITRSRFERSCRWRGCDRRRVAIW
jgi:hypothetical protein